MGSKRRTRGTSAPRQPAARGGARSIASRWRLDRVLAGSVLAALFVLAALGDDRHVGLVADGRQMIRTAVALAETGEIGQARARDFTLDRGAGDAVSRFGMATSLLQVPAAWLAPGVEERGPGRSQALFLVVPWLALGIAAAAAGAIARRLGGGDVEVVAAVLLASLASPLGSYALMEFSEPVQAAALTVALAAALAAAGSPVERRGLEVLAGLSAGLAVLTKSSLIVTVPLVLLPLVDLAAPRRSSRALLRAAAGALGPLIVWAGFEIVRFGRFFGGYPDDRFTHPWFDGLWRLLVGPNRGVLLFWPALLLFLWAGTRLAGAWRSTPAGRAWIGAGLVFGSQVAVAAGYWGWHGMEGWGPRLVLGALPLLAPFAAVAPGPRRRWLVVGAVVVCALVNLPPLVQHPTPVSTYVTNVAWPAVPDHEAPRYPFYATARSPEGRLTVVPFADLDREAAANPWRLYTWFWRGTRLDDRALADWLRQPPWAEARPDLVPPALPPEVARQIAPPPRFGFLGRSLTGTGGPYATVYLDALLDQVVRANQQGRLDRALDLSARRLRLQPDGEAAAWRLETLRRAGRPFEAEALLRALPEAARRHPLINLVLALFDRDGGEEQRARALVASVAGSFPGTPVQRALDAPVASWPATLDALTRAPRRDATVQVSPE
jgi:hypothetical protein